VVYRVPRSGRHQVKIKTKIRLLTMSKDAREKRLDELNQKLGRNQPQELEQVEEREWLKKKLGYKH
jgi:IS5 family transposase